MKSMALVVDERGAELSLSKDCKALVVRHKDGRQERIGTQAIGSVVLHGDVTLSSGVIRALASSDIGIICTALRGVSPTVSIASLPTRMVTLRHAQHRSYASNSKRLVLARKIVVAKIHAMYQAHSKSAKRRVKPVAALEHCETIQSLMGAEGTATKKHLALIARQLPSEFKFSKRSRRPPRDPFNALMSYCYSLALAPAAELPARLGLDPCLGFLHGIHRNRLSLALDILEPARPVIDRWLVDVVGGNNGLGRDQFYDSESDGVRLTKAGRREFLGKWFGRGHRLAVQAMRPLLADIVMSLRSDTEPG